MRFYFLILSGILTLSAAQAGTLTVGFTEVGALRGIGPYSQGIPTGGIAAADYDNDGDIDLFVPTNLGTPDLLYENVGGTFKEIGAAVGLNSTRWHRNAVWFDYDADFDLDLAVAGDCRVDPVPQNPTACPDPENLTLYQQQSDGSFVDVTAAAGLDVAWGGLTSWHRATLVAGDLNNDDYVDLYLASWHDRTWLFMNDGDGTFTDTAMTAGMGGLTWFHHSAIMYDFNGDGWLDIYQAIDIFDPNFLWINQQDGSFVDVARAAGVDYDATDMGIDLGDYDSDGDFDLYVTEMFNQNAGIHNVLYRNDSVGSIVSFTEVAEEQGVDDGRFGWGTSFFDVDLDGDVDLATTNGRLNLPVQWPVTDPSRFWLNDGQGPVWFEDVSTAIGFDDTEVASGLIAFDYDRDGDMDMVQATGTAGLRLLENNPIVAGPANHYLVVRPRSESPNHYALGAVVHVSAGALNMMRLITAGKSTLSQEPAESHFGLGTNTTADVTVEWPNGETTTHLNIAADQVITIPQHDMMTFPVGFRQCSRPQRRVTDARMGTGECR